MRISSGNKKGAELKRGKVSATLRPLTDKIKNALFSILFNKVKGAYILDLFAGTGIFGFEALSKGAEGVTFVDKNYKNIKLIKENAQKLRFDDKITVVNRDFKKAIEFLEKINKSFSIIFIDPPYNSDFAEQTIKHLSFPLLIKPDGLVIVRVFHKTQLPFSINNLTITDERKYGEAKVYFYELSSSKSISKK